MQSKELAREIVRILDSKKAKEITALEIGDLTTIGDYFVIASGGSNTQIKALADEIEEGLSKLGRKPKRVEGYPSALWILIDYGDVIVHIFHGDTREFYGIERLWSDAPRLDISDLLHE